jgi:hypothetical protein
MSDAYEKINKVLEKFKRGLITTEEARDEISIMLYFEFQNGEQS